MSDDAVSSLSAALDEIYALRATDGEAAKILDLVLASKGLGVINRRRIAAVRDVLVEAANGRAQHRGQGSHGRDRFREGLKYVGASLTLTRAGWDKERAKRG